MRNGASLDEAARSDACDPVDLRAYPGLHHFGDRAAEGSRLAEHRRDVAEYDAGLLIVRDRADCGLEIGFEHGMGHGVRACGALADGTDRRPNVAGARTWRDRT